MNRLLLESARAHATRVAVVDGGSRTTTYADLLAKSLTAKAGLRELGVRKGDRVCVFGERSADFAAIQWAAWRLGAISVTLLPSYPPKELAYYIEDSGAKLVVATDGARASEAVEQQQGRGAAQVVSPQVVLGTAARDGEDDDERVHPEDAANLFYTSGSTSNPKGVLTTHGALEAMVSGMVQAWEWSKDDSILHFLPLHHVHGAVNKLLTPLAVGAKVEFVEFDAERILGRLNNANPDRRPTVFMGVPTIYAKLVEQWEKDDKPTLENLAKLRLFVSGSAPLPVHLFEKFKRLSGQTILERWGMTEVGMGLSNPLRPESQRLPGYVGLPMPGIEVKIADLDADRDGKILIPPNTPGDLLIRGSSVFKTYWGKAAPLTQSEFTSDGEYFKTGDVAIYDDQVNSYKIVGRKSVDVIKSGGFKISALEIERHLLESQDIAEVAVLGIPDAIWGEAVVAIVVPKKKVAEKVTEKSVQDFAASEMVKYKVPKKVLVMDSIPKNAMGKVNKKSLRELFK